MASLDTLQQRPCDEKTYGGSESGKGAYYTWEGNQEVGQGEITIAETTPPNQLVFDLHMMKPFEGRNIATFTLTPAGDATTVTWSLDDKQKLMMKVMSLFVNMDKMIGKDFETGLANLKQVVEK